MGNNVYYITVYSKIKNEYETLELIALIIKQALM